MNYRTDNEQNEVKIFQGQKFCCIEYLHIFIAIYIQNTNTTNSGKHGLFGKHTDLASQIQINYFKDELTRYL